MRCHLMKLPISVLMLLTASPLIAHEIKVLASHLHLADGPGRATVYLSWGHRMPVDDLIDAKTIDQYAHVPPKGKPIELAKSDLSLQANAVFFEEAGVHQIFVKRKASINTYILDEKGERQFKRGPKTLYKDSKIDSAARNQQCAKAIVIVGKPGNDAPKALGQAIEIVPLDGPAAWSTNATLRFKVLLEGKPLSGAEVTARYVGFRPDDAWCTATKSQRNGECTIRPHQPGTWVLKVTTQRAAPESLRDQFDFDKHTATLTIEILP